MSFFSATVAAAAAGSTVRATFLIELGFASGTKRVWQGYGNLVTLDGNTWRGTGSVGQLEGLDQALNGAAPKFTITVSGVTAEAVRAAISSWWDARGRPLRVYLQFFDDATRAALDMPQAILYCTMEQIQPDYSGPGKRDLLIHCENQFAARGFPVNGRLSDRDQQARYPGDRGCERIPMLQLHVVTWPRA